MYVDQVCESKCGSQCIHNITEVGYVFCMYEEIVLYVYICMYM
jgi:hypothetical protein